jgi:peptide/nickel transport system ATP-binding protein
MSTTVKTSSLLAVKNLRAFLPTDRGWVQAVDGVTLSLEAGQALGLVGESGCGKSMLGRALMGLLPAKAMVSKASRIAFQGQELNRMTPRERRDLRGQKIAMIFQDPMTSLNPVMKIGHQVAEALRHHMQQGRRVARQRAVALLQMVGIPMPRRRAGQYPHQLSGGLRQRVAIAIALACDPQLLIADEPTTALDVTVQAEILDLLAHLRQQTGMALILITHDLGLVAGRTDTTAVMYAGKIVEQAPTADLFTDMRMPYTHALMRAIPRIDDPPHTRLQAIPGQPPQLVAPPGGCRFAPRCPHAGQRCMEEEPPLKPMDGSEHRFACWFPIS